MNKAFLSALVALAAFAVLVAGCGGGDDTTGSDATVTLTKAEFIEQGDEICEQADEQSQSDAEEFAEDNDFELEGANKKQLESAIGAVLGPSLTQQAEEIDALGAPEGDEEKIEEIVVSLEGAAGEIEEDPGLVFEEGALDEPSELAKSYGFKVCGEG